MHHLHLSDRDIGDFDSHCRLVPPLRDPRDRERLRRALAEGIIDAVCSDHAPVDEDAKQVPFGEAEPGATGLELLLPLTLQWGGKAGSASRRRSRGSPSDAGARPGCRGGTLRAGRRGGHLPLRSAGALGVKPAALASQGKNTPFTGLELTGRVVRTLVGGRTVHAA